KLRDGEASVSATAFTVDNGYAKSALAWPATALPAKAPARTFAPTVPIARKSAADRAANLPMVGRFTKTFNYSGPVGTLVHVETGAKDGKPVYMDAPVQFAQLPEALV